ncbi:TBC1D15 [Mytilus edulis]|uniref:TBC1D15 n=1 Tax=Mytilus edulis TaxID=6550 RepID=A0A8S3T1E7_MYTED|nr:TBC1D15 [Mytilus edulis]
MPDVASEAQEDGAIIDENRPDLQVFHSALDQCGKNIDLSKFVVDETNKEYKAKQIKTSVKSAKGQTHHDKGQVKGQTEKVVKDFTVKKDSISFIDPVLKHADLCQEGACSSEGNDIKEEGFDNFNHFKINSESFSDNHDNTTCASCKSERQKCEDKQVFVRSGDNSAICKNKTILKGDNCIQGTEQLDGSHLGRVLDQSRPLQSEDSSRSVENLNGTTDLSSADLHQNLCDSNIEAVKNNKKKSTLHLDCSQTVPMETNQLSGTFSPAFKREKPLCKEEFEKMFDEDGRIVDEHALRKAVFMGGVDPSIRKKVWHFLFGFFLAPQHQGKYNLYRNKHNRETKLIEREDILIDYMMKYHEQKSRWKTMLVLNAKPGASLLEQGLVARYQIDTTNRAVRSPDGEFNDPISEFETLQFNLMAGKMKTADPDFKAMSKSFPDLNINSPELKQKIDFMKIQSQGPLNPNLTVLREVLATFAAFHPKIGYAQGMNDILARFLVVFDSEVETYWCFSHYMSKIQQDFTEEGMVRKIELVVELLEEMDLELLQHLRQHDMGDLMFCHRWLLLGFKREMPFPDSLRCFEILSSHHLELSSLEAETARRKQTMKEFQNLGGITRTARLDTECEYTFELFMCLALLEECRDDLLQSTDTAAVFTVINNVKIDLDDILCKSADLFYKYCKKSVDDSFLMVELPSAGKRRHKLAFRK